ncbi:unnamed protein product [Darwinula stevensoni]|uniref:Uncharacterized protein n=1 Tax=Darwinula stevensoni TaxID=69355 RepID=A0A7R8X7E9_9CRUS|nr:unnamed protein product [Darwinula stevensoni]CAG0883195.1 unnamed protein product [Darwinula stevensoni]
MGNTKGACPTQTNLGNGGIHPTNGASPTQTDLGMGEGTPLPNRNLTEIVRAMGVLAKNQGIQLDTLIIQRVSRNPPAFPRERRITMGHGWQEKPKKSMEWPGIEPMPHDDLSDVAPPHHRKVRRAFRLEDATDIILQAFHPKWDQWIDVENLEEIPPGTKILKAVVESTQHTDTGTVGNRSPGRVHEEVFIGPSSHQPSDLDMTYQVGVAIGSSGCADGLAFQNSSQTNPETWDKEKHDLPQLSGHCLVEMKLDHDKYVMIARAITDSYPHLAEPCGLDGNPWDAWKGRIIDKVNNERKSKRRFSKGALRNPILDGVPAGSCMPPGEDEKSLQLHIKTMKIESRKRQVDKKKVQKLLDVTFCLRYGTHRLKKVSEMLEVYPCLSNAVEGRDLDPAPVAVYTGELWGKPTWQVWVEGMRLLTESAVEAVAVAYDSNTSLTVAVYQKLVIQ